MPVMCRKCLLAEMEEERPLYLLMREWLEAILPEDRAAPEVYAARLGQCKACGELANGMCRQCGCYVELRAARARMGCPKPDGHWVSER